MIWLSVNFDVFMQNLLRLWYEKILLLTSVNLRGDYRSIYIGDSESTVDFGGAVSAVSVGAGSFSMESLLLKMSSYEDEYDAPLDDLLAADVQSATLQYKAATGVDVVTILSDLVGKLPESMQSVLAGKTFKATMMNGRMEFELFPLAA
jgi:hypothetical protein